ncbi:hypothetical protein SRM_01654 [Salinibacter ruber M8]|uniref:Uncharacterized protein n=1 Tax=Salinibacter ruber (strain M8) TaxID=761659 RepID=D5H970_SALRM|nr:hypothetical protein SRM_01654 [Salinibacter ruber M8]
MDLVNARSISGAGVFLFLAEAGERTWGALTAAHDGIRRCLPGLSVDERHDGALCTSAAEDAHIGGSDTLVTRGFATINMS